MVSDSKPLKRWADSNGMVMNMPKTKCMVVGICVRLHSQISKCLDLSISNTPIDQVEEHKLLGLVLSISVKLGKVIWTTSVPKLLCYTWLY